MGTDIHWVVEEKIEGEWTGVSSSWGCGNVRASDRNYAFFCALAGVRGKSEMDYRFGNVPQGVPADISRLSKKCLEFWGSDAHSKSNLALKEFLEIYNLIERKMSDVYDLFKLDMEGEDLDNFRFIFWFDN